MAVAVAVAVVVVVVVVGFTLRGGALVEQAGQIKTLATAEMDRFKQEQLLGDAHIVALDDAVAVVLKGLHDRTLATGESHLQTAGQATAMHECRHRPDRLPFSAGSPGPGDQLGVKVALGEFRVESGAQRGR